MAFNQEFKNLAKHVITEAKRLIKGEKPHEFDSAYDSVVDLVHEQSAGLKDSIRFFEEQFKQRDGTQESHEAITFQMSQASHFVEILDITALTLAKSKKK